MALRLWAGLNGSAPDSSWLVIRDPDEASRLLARRVVGRLIVGLDCQGLVASLARSSVWPTESIEVQGAAPGELERLCAPIEAGGRFDPVPGRPGAYRRPPGSIASFALFARTFIWIEDPRTGRGARVGEPFELSGAVPPCHVLTAHNPLGRDAGEQENRAAHARLVAALDELGAEHRAAVGSAPDGSHSEQSVAAWGLPGDACLRLGREFGQLAIFAVRSDGIVLRDTSPLTRAAGRTMLDLSTLTRSAAEAERAATAFRRLVRAGGLKRDAECELRAVTTADGSWLPRLARMHPAPEPLPW